MDSLIPILICIVVVLTFGGLMLSVARLLSAGAKAPPTKAKSLPYECGLQEEEKANSKVPVQFYQTAILFILFDIEIIFLYPFALAFKDFLKQGSGLSALLAMTLFLLVFIYGLCWEIGSNALKWR